MYGVFGAVWLDPRDCARFGLAFTKSSDIVMFRAEPANLTSLDNNMNHFKEH